MVENKEHTYKHTGTKRKNNTMRKTDLNRYTNGKTKKKHFFLKFFPKMFGDIKKIPTFALSS